MSKDFRNVLHNQLEGKAVVITGAGRGLGRAYAEFAARHGARVVVNDIDRDIAYEVASEICASGGTAVPNANSVADWEGSQAIIESCIDAFGHIDGLVSNAAIIFYENTPWEHTEDAVKSIVDVNVLGTIYPTLHAINHMKDTSSGSIIIVCSSSHLGIPGVALYGATKGATVSFMRCMNCDLQGTGIRINGISPGANTRMTEGTNVVGSPDYIAPLVGYLLSDLSSDVSGQLIRFYAGNLSLIGLPTSSAGHEQSEWTIEQIKSAIDSEIGS